MAGLGIGPDEFAAFRLRDPEARGDALESVVGAALGRVADGVASGLSRVAGAPLAVQPGKLLRKKGVAPEEAFVAFCAPDRLYLKAPFLMLAVTRAHLHARVAARGGSDRDGAMARALRREAANLARKGKPFRKLRSYAGWEYEDLPEIAAAHSTAFWEEQADALAPEASAGAGLDVGVAWTAEEARNLAVGDLLGAYRDLAPLYKLLANAR
jgi:hypothetical protein